MAFVGKHIVRCNATGTHELLHEPVASAVKPRLRYCSRLSRLQVGPAGSADGVVPVLEAKPVPECKECVRPLAPLLLVPVPAVRPGVAGDDDRLVHCWPHPTLDLQCHRIRIKELEHLLQLDLPCKLLEHHDLAARIREPSASVPDDCPACLGKSVLIAKLLPVPGGPTKVMILRLACKAPGGLP